MLKKFILSVCLITCTLAAAWSQEKLLSNIFKDITLKDIQGAAHRPYDHLTTGKIVFLNVFSTNCGPCWEYQEQNQLQDLYELYGPSGLNQIEILAVEGNLNTLPEDLAGTGSNTLGDFISSSNFPVIDDHYFPFDLGIHTFPTLLYICPDKKIYQIPYMDMEELEILIETGCPDMNGYNNLDILYFSCDLEPTCTIEDYVPTVVVQNNGDNTIEHVSLNYNINGQSFGDSIGFDVFLEKYEIAEIPLGIESNDRSLDIQANVLWVNGALDTFTTHNNIQATKPIIESTTNEYTIEITTDAFGYEIYWEIENDYGAVVASGGNDLVIPGAQQDVTHLLSNANYYASDDSITADFFLDDYGCYTFRIYDDYGDGLCCNFGEGKFTIKNANGTTIIENQLFLEEMEVEFLFDQFAVASTEEILEKSAFSIYPNPCSIDQLMVNFSAAFSGNTTLSVYNAQGQLFSSYPYEVSKGLNSIPLDVSELEQGIYFLSATIHNENIAQSFSVLRH